MAVQENESTLRQVAQADISAPTTTPFGVATRDFVFGEIWTRPGISRRDRRWVSLTCAASASVPKPLTSHVYSALKSRDVDLPAMLEFVLHFAVYGVWPKAAELNAVVRQQWELIQRELGTDAAWPYESEDDLLLPDVAARIESGRRTYEAVKPDSAPVPDTPFFTLGVLGFAYGYVWQRPALSRRERRIITIACAAIGDSSDVLTTHVSAAFASGDLTKQEMDEIVLHFAMYHGFVKGAVLAQCVESVWADVGA